MFTHITCLDTAIKSIKIIKDPTKMFIAYTCLDTAIKSIKIIKDHTPAFRIHCH